jgi:NADH dehydrogenase (ubiquinone) 1 alpha subcomplex subunit 12
MHKIADEPPTIQPLVRPTFSSLHTENLTGTRKAFKTYNTTAPKILAWEPKVNRRKHL